MNQLEEILGTAFLNFFWPGYQNEKYLMPFYQAVNDAIREVDNDTILFYEPTVFDIFGGGFKTNVGGPDYRDREIFSYHVYCGVVNAQGEPKLTLLCKLLDMIFVDTKLKKCTITLDRRIFN